MVSDGTKELYSVKEIRHIYNDYAATFIKKEFPIINVTNIADTSRHLKTIFKTNTLVILLAKTGCSPCQLRELKNLAELKKRKNTLNIIAVLNENERLRALKLKKIAHINFPFYYTFDNNLDVFNKFKKYPLICLIKGQKVEKCLLPIPIDKQYSLKFYNNF